MPDDFGIAGFERAQQGAQRCLLVGGEADTVANREM
jgi:hypothetical protein